MKRKVIVDSVCDLTKEQKEEFGISVVPLTLEINGKEYIDDGSLSREDYLQAMEGSDSLPKTASPSPHRFVQAMQGADEYFIITISSRMSSTYHAAQMAADYVMAEQGARVHVFDSGAVGAAETYGAIPLARLCRTDHTFTEIVNLIQEHFDRRQAFGVLQSVRNLAKSGRLPDLARQLVSKLQIYPVLTVANGLFKVRVIRRSHRQALKVVADTMKAFARDHAGHTLYISDIDSSGAIRELIRLSHAEEIFKDIQIMRSGGPVTCYGDKGGIIVAY